MQTLWWLHSLILRHIHKKRFSVFLSHFLRICGQSFKEVLIRAKKNFFSKIQYGYQKMQNFSLISNPLKKVIKKKLLAKTWRKYTLFSLLLMFVKLVLLITFFGEFFNNFFNGFEISVKFCDFWHLFCYFQKKNFFRSYLYFFQTLKPNAQKTAKKIKKRI